jgi:hypothetical protein
MADVTFTGTGTVLDTDRDVQFLGRVRTVDGDPAVEVGSALALDLVPARPDVTKGAFLPAPFFSTSPCVGVPTPNFVPVGPMPVPDPDGVVLNSPTLEIIIN